MNKIPTTDTLEHEHLGRLMCRYAIPCMISLLVAALYSMPVADALTFLISLAAIIHTYRGLQRAMDAQTLPAQGDRSAGRS